MYTAMAFISSPSAPRLIADCVFNVNVASKAHELSKHLRHILAPHFLCRTKADTFNTGKNAGTEDKQEQDAALEQQKQALSTRMNDFIVWVRLTEVRIRHAAFVRVRNSHS